MIKGKDGLKKIYDVVSFNGVIFSNTTLDGVCLKGAILDNCNLTNVNLSNMDLTNTNLSNVDLSTTILSNTVLKGANLRNANLTNTDLTGANFTSLNLSNVDLSNKKYGVDFHLENNILVIDYYGNEVLQHLASKGANIQNVTVSNTTKCSSKTSCNSSTVLSNTNLSGANLSGSHLSGTSIISSNLTNTNLSGIYFENANWTNANLSNANFTSLTNNNFSNQIYGSDWKYENGAFYDSMASLSDITYTLGYTKSNSAWADTMSSAIIGKINNDVYYAYDDYVYKYATDTGTWSQAAYKRAWDYLTYNDIEVMTGKYYDSTSLSVFTPYGKVSVPITYANGTPYNCVEYNGKYYFDERTNTTSASTYLYTVTKDSNLTTSSILVSSSVTPDVNGGLAFGNGIMLYTRSSSNQIHYSRDLVNWISGTINSFVSGYYLSNVVFGNGKFVTVGVKSNNNSYVFYSEDAINWYRVQLNIQYPKYNTYNLVVTFVNNKFVITSGNGAQYLYVSDDAINWQQSNLSVVIPHWNRGTRILYVHGKYFIVYGKQYYVSDDLINWENHTFSTPTQYIYHSKVSTSFAGNKIIAGYVANNDSSSSTADPYYYYAGVGTVYEWTPRT